MTDTPMTPDAALTRLRQYGELTSTWSTATYNDGTEKALHEIALTLATEVQQWRATFGEKALPGALAEMNRLRARVAELEGRPIEAHVLRQAAAQVEDDYPEAAASLYKAANGAEHAAARRPWQAADLAEGQAQLDAMRADHPAPCRVPDSPDCTCPDEEPPLSGDSLRTALHGHLFGGSRGLDQR
ncbi:hypothetical protein E6R18_32895 [Streptomyces sp. A1277]|uniref:hypothetical protein n=1 Tax=Streptomyces sp. A1277 TaxID=2563103 RepID=UPI0010A22AEA|nr:hypothetical protein [Streptomyces sp. A1277]THA22746.1 hypothetical protein E6R18_32895 [Streptomyces sp. A1277]